MNGAGRHPAGDKLQRAYRLHQSMACRVEALRVLGRVLRRSSPYADGVPGRAALDSDAPPKRGMIGPPPQDAKLHARRRRVGNLLPRFKDAARHARRRGKTRRN